MQASAIWCRSRVWDYLTGFGRCDDVMMNLFRYKITVACFLAWLVALPLVSFCEGIPVINPQTAKVLAVSEPDRPRQDQKVRLRIVSFNDFHGSYRETGGSLGAAKFVTAIQDYARQFPNDYPTAVCVLSAGDILTGTALSYYSIRHAATENENGNNLLNTFFSLTGVTGACLGNHEYDWGPKFLEDHTANTMVAVNGKKHHAYSSSNIVNTRTGLPPGGIPSYDRITLQDHDFTIAVIALSTMETVTKSLPGFTEGYRFESPGACAKRHVELLKDDVDGFIFLTHLAAYSDENGKLTLAPASEAEDILEMVKLKPLAIITAHSHNRVVDTLDGVPIVQARHYANALASVNLILDSATKTTVVESLDYVDLLSNRESLNPNAEMLAAVNQAESLCNYATVADNTMELRRNRNAFTPLGALVAKALSTSFTGITKDEPLLAFQHSGGIRIDLLQGEITEEHCFNLLPFESRMSLCKLPGESLMQLIREGVANPNGYLQSYGLKLYYDSASDEKTDFRFVTFHHRGKDYRIQPEQEYWVVIDYFVVSGGDGYSREIFEDHIVVQDGPVPRDVFAQFLKDNLGGHITLSDSDLVSTVILANLQTIPDYLKPDSKRTDRIETAPL